MVYTAVYQEEEDRQVAHQAFSTMGNPSPSCG